MSREKNCIFFNKKFRVVVNSKARELQYRRIKRVLQLLGENPNYFTFLTDYDVILYHLLGDFIARSNGFLSTWLRHLTAHWVREEYSKAEKFFSRRKCRLRTFSYILADDSAQLGAFPLPPLTRLPRRCSTLSFLLCMPQHSYECVSELFTVFFPLCFSWTKGKHETHFPIQNIKRRKSIHVLCEMRPNKTRDFLPFFGQWSLRIVTLVRNTKFALSHHHHANQGHVWSLFDVVEGGKLFFSLSTRFALVWP